MADCPKCGAARPSGAVECPRCGVIYARFDAAQVKKRAGDELAAKLTAEEAAKSAAPQEQPQPTGPNRLAACAACGKDVSVMADSCPHCGHPVDKTLRLSPLERRLTRIWQAILALTILLVMLGVMYCTHRLSIIESVPNPAARPAPVVQKPNIRTNVPFTIPEGEKVLGCHDINDYWMLRGFAKDGKEAWMEQLRPRLADGRCGAVAAGRGTALEILPTGVAEIRDSRGAKWYTNASAVDEFAD